MQDAQNNVKPGGVAALKTTDEKDRVVKKEKLSTIERTKLQMSRLAKREDKLTSKKTHQFNSNYEIDGKSSYISKEVQRLRSMMSLSSQDRFFFFQER